MYSVPVASWCGRPRLESSGGDTSPQRKPWGALPKVRLGVRFCSHDTFLCLAFYGSIQGDSEQPYPGSLLKQLRSSNPSGTYCHIGLQPQAARQRVLNIQLSRVCGTLLHQDTESSVGEDDSELNSLSPNSSCCPPNVLPAQLPQWKEKAPEGTRASRKKESSPGSMGV